MQANYKSQRLLLYKLTSNDADFFSELANSPEWIEYIGDRNIKSKEAATKYIQNIIDNPNADCWVVKTQGQQTSIGVITFIKRDYLDHHDIGFAFLAKYTKQGYAYEATVTVLNDVIKNPEHSHILATTIKENTNSIQLLKKLGFEFNKEIKREKEMLMVYSALTEKIKKNFSLA